MSCSGPPEGVAVVPTPYLELNHVLQELVSRTRAVLGQELIGVYLQGSFAVGDFDEHSDVDFVVVTLAELEPRLVEALQAMHVQIYQLDSKWARSLEGSYFPGEILRQPPLRGQELWYLDNGARHLIRSDHCNTLVVRRVVRERGIALFGPPPQTLVDPIPSDLLRAEMMETVTHWGREILDDPARFRNRFYQGFIVLSYCRMLHELYSGCPGSKREGAEWAKSTLDPSWADLIDAAWSTRPDPARQVREPADPEAFDRTLRFVEHVMKHVEAAHSAAQSESNVSAAPAPDPRLNAMLELRSRRLRLVAATAASVRSELEEPSRLRGFVGATVPAEWPPETLREALPQFLEWHAEHPDWSGWLGWYAIRVDTEAPLLCGSAGFMGPPDRNGMVEIGYSVLPAHQGQGLATEMVGMLVSWACAHAGVRCVEAETTLDNRASIRVLERAGFLRVTVDDTTGSVRYRFPGGSKR